jgi:hypothetical protein
MEKKINSVISLFGVCLFVYREKNAIGEYFAWQNI